MSAENAYALMTLLIAVAGVLLAAGSLGSRGILAALPVVGLIGWLGAAVLGGRNHSDLATNLLIVAVIACVALAYLRLGWLARRRWPLARCLMILAALAGLAGLGVALMRLFPGTGFLPDLAYLLAIGLVAVPAAVSFGAGLTAAALFRRA